MSVCIFIIYKFEQNNINKHNMHHPVKSQTVMVNNIVSNNINYSSLRPDSNGRLYNQAQHEAILCQTYASNY